MGLKFKKLFGVNISITSIDDVLDETRKYLKKSEIRNPKFEKRGIKPLVIFTPNPEIVVYAQKDKMFKKIVNSAQINIPDGHGVVWAFKKLFNLDIKAITGIDLMKKLSRESANKGYRIGLIGGREGLAIEVSECLLKSYPKLKIEVFDEPDIKIRNSIPHVAGRNYENSDNYFKDLVREINQKKIDILFVALGFPKQEYFVCRLSLVASRPPAGEAGLQNKRPLVMMGVGGSFDYISGRIKRAPKFIRDRGLEWLYRLLQEPWRIKRHIAGSRFFLQVLLNGKSNSTILPI